MKVEVELDDTEIQRKVVEQLVVRMNYQAEVETSRMVKDIILTEIRSAVKEHAADIVKTMTLPDGRSVKEYISDRLINANPSSRPERVGIQALIDATIANYAHSWYNELLTPYLAKIKDQIKEEFVSRLWSSNS